MPFTLRTKREILQEVCYNGVFIFVKVFHGRKKENTLKSFGMYAAELFLLDGMPKKPILNVLKPHIFFDDQLKHLQENTIPSVLIPFGINSK